MFFFHIKKLINHVSVFLKGGILSNKDINKFLGTQIFIYPFDEDNIKGASYNLTASICAFVKNKDKKEELIIDNNDEICIPAKSTAIIQTQESIYVSNRICGTYHSRVSLVSKGLGHIGTTLDPCYFGTSAIALHNTTEETIGLKIGEPIVSIMFYCVRSKSDGGHDNLPGRRDILNLNLDEESFYDFKRENIEQENGGEEYKRNEVLKKFNEWKDMPWRNDKNKLIKEVEKYVKKRDVNKNLLWESIMILFFTPIVQLGIFAILKQINICKNNLTGLKVDVSGSLRLVAIIISIYVTFTKFWVEFNKEGRDETISKKNK